MLVLAATLPYPAGLILAGAATALLCSAFHGIANRIRGQEIEWEIVYGGVLVAGFLCVLGATLVGLGAPAFE